MHLLSRTPFTLPFLLHPSSPPPTHQPLLHHPKTFLTEYEVATISIQRSSFRNYSVAEVGVTLHRRFWSYVTSAYLPTVMLMLISYASLFCKRENVDLRVMMALTTLLVLYALYQQISDDLPKTAYTKAIDIWCFFAITMMFTQVGLVVRRAGKTHDYDNGYINITD